MAVETSLLDRGMLELHLGDSVADCLVAANAEIICRLQQVILIVGRMGIMTAHAVPLGGYLMSTEGLGRNDFVVAFDADCFRGRVQKLSVGTSMGIVTSRALRCLHWRVNELALQLFLEIGMAIETKLPLGSRFEFELVLCACERKCEGEGYRKQEQDPMIFGTHQVSSPHVLRPMPRLGDVAFVTRSRCEGWVDILPEEFGIV